MNPKIKSYIEQNIFPEYEKNDAGHQLSHIHYVITRSFKLAKELEEINYDMLYVAASYHDIAHHINKNTHEILSAEIFFKDEKMKQFFSLEDRILIKEAIEDHRASLNRVPRSIYGKIISTADRSTDLTSLLKRTHAYSKKHFSTLSSQEMIDRAYTHLKNKYGKEGYAKSYLFDKEYEKFKQEVGRILKDKTAFQKLYLQINKKED